MTEGGLVRALTTLVDGSIMTLETIYLVKGNHMTADIPLPAGALTVDDWHIGRRRNITRTFHGTKRGRVEILGEQEYFGGIVRSRHATVDVDVADMFDSAALRRLAANALATADELDAS